jgi:hypothetical protein
VELLDRLIVNEDVEVVTPAATTAVSVFIVALLRDWKIL